MTPGFSPPDFPVITSDGRNFIISGPISYFTREGEEIIISPGARSDGASTPPGLWLTLPPFGRYWRAAVLHDFLYRMTQKPKDECDRLFLEAMEVTGVPEMEAKTMFEGVHLGGWKSFKEDRQNQGATK